MIKYFSAILSILLLFICTGCSQNAKTIALSDFKKEDAGFLFRNLQWGSSVEEVEKLLNVSLETNKYGEVEENIMGAPTDSYFLSDVTFDGVKGQLHIEFLDSGLFSVIFNGIGEEDSVRGLFSNTIENLKEKFGEETEFIDKDMNPNRNADNGNPNENQTPAASFHTTGYRWDDANFNTTCQAVLTYGEDARTSITIGVSRLPAASAS